MACHHSRFRWFGGVVTVCVVACFLGATGGTSSGASSSSAGHDPIKPYLFQETAPTPTSLSMVWATRDAKRVWLYENAGRRAPGAPHRRPDGPPLRAMKCPCNGRITVGG